MVRVEGVLISAVITSLMTFDTVVGVEVLSMAGQGPSFLLNSEACSGEREGGGTSEPERSKRIGCSGGDDVVRLGLRFARLAASSVWCTGFSLPVKGVS